MLKLPVTALLIPLVPSLVVVTTTSLFWLGVMLPGVSVELLPVDWSSGDDVTVPLKASTDSEG
jgi:hypothetical protein